MVNKATGEPHEQLRERHDASDFELRTEDKLHPAEADTEAVADFLDQTTSLASFHNWSRRASRRFSALLDLRMAM